MRFELPSCNSVVVSEILEVHYFAYCLFRVSDYLYVNKYNKILSREKVNYCLQGQFQSVNI